jgi:HTH domain
MPANNKSVIDDRRQRLFALLTKGMKGYEIARMLNVDAATVSRDIKYLTADSNNYLNGLAKQTLPFMFHQSIEGVRDVLKESWKIYQSEDMRINWFHRIAALKLAKECYEAQFKLLNEGPSVLAVRQLEEKLLLIENRH